MTLVHGFQLVRAQPIPELYTTARLYRHRKTGARLLSLDNSDPNKVFGIAFRTPPRDSTGVAHVLEHMVVCGSRRYPVKKLLMELIKGSLQTFINAYTDADKTFYALASQHRQDFYNLIGVYLDAVFFPQLTPQLFQQEGWHYALESPDEPLRYQGVVLTEMQGIFSSPEARMDELARASLFPDTPYGLNYAGDPRHIPDLSFEALKSFHAAYYHPSNAWIVFYGDDHSDERLRIVDDYLRAFEPIQVESSIPSQACFTAPRRIVEPYAAPAARPGAQRGMVTINWMFDAYSSIETDLGIEILAELLIGSPAGLLRQPLIDSGLGQQLIGVGLDSTLRQSIFSTGLKGIDVADVPAIETLVFQTLERLTRGGVDQDASAAAINTVAYRLLDYPSGPFPRGLQLMLRALTTWLYERDPISTLAFRAPLEAIKQRVAAGEPYFERLIGDLLLHNNHRTTVALRPDPDAALREAQVEQERLRQIHSSMSLETLAAIIENARALRMAQQEPESPTILATLPVLNLSDLSRTNRSPPLEVLHVHDTTVLYQSLEASAIIYLQLGMDLRLLPAALLPYAALFGRALLELGNTTLGTHDLARRIHRATGGIIPQIVTSVVQEQDVSVARLFLRAKCMPDACVSLLEILEAVLCTPWLDDRQRFRQIVLEEQASQEGQLLPEGHIVVDRRMRARFNEAGWVAEQTGGVAYLFFLRQLLRRIDTDWSQIQAHLHQIRQLLINRSTLVWQISVDQASWRTFQPRLFDFMRCLPTAPVNFQRWEWPVGPCAEGLALPTQVSYAGQAVDLFRAGYTSGSAAAIAKYLFATFLWEKVRMQNGAYTPFCIFDRQSGGLSFVSYRDPNPLATLGVYDQISRFLREVSPSTLELTKTIIGAIGELDTYLPPEALGNRAVIHYLSGFTSELRQQIREEILSTTIADFRRCADALATTDRNQIATTLLGPLATLEQIDKVRAGGLCITELL